MDLVVTAVLPVLLGRADVVEQGPMDATPSGLLAGVGRADITPPKGIAQLNWGSQTHVVAEGNDPVGMCVTALVISDGKQKFAMVDIDVLSVDGLEEVIGRAAAASGIPPAHIRLAASHTHAGPAVSRAKGTPGIDLSPHEALFRTWWKMVSEKIVAVVVEANAALRPVHLYGARGTGTININRRVRAAGGMPAAVGRNPEAFVDRELVVARIDDAEGKPYAVLVNYQCHGTVLGHENKLISLDWIGMMRQVVEQALVPAKCLFFQGAAGNQGPVEGFSGDLSVAHRLGSILGYQGAALALGVETVRREPAFEGFVESTAYQAKQPWRVRGPREATLKFALRTIEVPQRRYTPQDIEEMRKLAAEARAKVEQMKGSGDVWKRHQAEARLRRYADLLEQYQRPAEAVPLKVQVQVLRIGEVAMVAMAGEPFAEIGAAVKKASPFPVTMFCGYSSGAGGDYMPVEAEYRLGGYEVERTPYGPAAGGMVIKKAIELLKEVRR